VTSSQLCRFPGGTNCVPRPFGCKCKTDPHSPANFRVNGPFPTLLNLQLRSVFLKHHRCAAPSPSASLFGRNRRNSAVRNGNPDPLQPLIGCINASFLFSKPTVNREMRRISCDHLRLRKYLGQSYDGCITKSHLRVLGRERTQVGHVFPGQKSPPPEELRCLRGREADPQPGATGPVCHAASAITDSHVISGGASSSKTLALQACHWSREFIQPIRGPVSVIYLSH